MELPQLIVISILLLQLIFVISGKLRMDLAGILTALSLGLAQSLGIEVLGSSASQDSTLRALAGLAQPVTVILFSLIIITKSLEKTGVTRWLARCVVAGDNVSERRLITLLMSLGALLSLFINTLAAGALLLPGAIEVSRRARIPVSKLLIPVAYGACLGGGATYFTTSNIIASDMLRAANPPQTPLGLFDFTAVGGLIAIVGIALFWWIGPTVLPVKEPSGEQQFARRTGSELEASYALTERLWEVVLPANSPMIGKPVISSGVGARLGVTILAVIRGKQRLFAPTPDLVFQPDDKIQVVGREERILALGKEIGAPLAPSKAQESLTAGGARFLEIVLIPESRAEGNTLKQLSFRSRYGATAVAIRRDGRSYRTDVADMVLRQGDSILALGTDERIGLLARSPDFLVIETDSSDRPTEWNRAGLVLAALLLGIVASTLGLPIYVSMLSVATLVVLARLLTMEEVYRSMEWQSIVLIAGMYPLSLAIVHTGLASQMGNALVGLVAPWGPMGLVVIAFVITGAISQVVAGQVTTLITAPPLISAAIALGVNPQAVAVSAALACSTVFLTPFSHPVQTLMMGPGNYRFGDFFRSGWLLTLISLLTLIVGMRIFWEI